MDLFHRHRSKYYALIRQWYSEGLLAKNQLEARKKSSLSAREDLVHYDYILTLQLHQDNYCFSSLKEGFDPVLPLLFTQIEKKYLKTLLEQPLFRTWLGEEATAELTQYLVDTQPFPLQSFIQNMHQGGEAFSLNSAETFLHLYQGIVEKRLVSFSYQGTDNIVREQQEYYPYRLLLDKETGLWQLLAFTQNEKTEVVCNLARMNHVTITQHWFSEDLKELLQKNRENQELLLKLRPDKNSIERSFLHFHDYQCTPSYDKAKEEYHIAISYHPDWDEEDLFSKVLSLGSAVEVLEPQSFRTQIIEELKQLMER